MRVGRIGTFGALLVCGIMIGASALTQNPGPHRNASLVAQVQRARDANEDLTARLAAARAEVDRLSAERLVESDPVQRNYDTLAPVTGHAPVAGPGLSVTIDDAPRDVNPPGVAVDLLIVHQQDIQAVVNALWSGGAEAMTIQGRRVTATTGIKCVGNTVVVHGIPYAPPYTVVAVGDPARLADAIDRSPQVRAFREQARTLGLGYSVARLDRVTMPAFEGSVELRYAVPR